MCTRVYKMCSMYTTIRNYPRSPVIRSFFRRQDKARMRVATDKDSRRVTPDSTAQAHKQTGKTCLIVR